MITLENSDHRGAQALRRIRVDLNGLRFGSVKLVGRDATRGGFPQLQALRVLPA